MLLLIVGLVLFLGFHTVPVLQGTKAALTGKLGANGYKGLFSLGSAIGLGLIIYGYGLARSDGSPLLYDPPVWTRHITMLLMLPVFVLLIAAYVPSHIREKAKHPMLAAVKLWAFSHLLANGDLASVLLFGGFLAWAVIDRISLKRRGNPVPANLRKPAPSGWAADAGVILAGLVLYGLTVWKLHALVIGVPLS